MEDTYLGVDVEADMAFEGLTCLCKGASTYDLQYGETYVGMGPMLA